MLSHFVLKHIPALFVATATSLGGLLPFYNAEHALLEFGLPRRIAISEEAQTVSILKGTRISTIGLILWTFYAQGKLVEFDTVLTILGFYVGAVDAFICFREGMGGKAVFRGLSGLVIGGWGMFGVTSS